MGFLGRKISEIGSALYRNMIWPWIRAYKELSTHSIMKQRSYIIKTRLEGRNYVGKEAFLKNCSMGYGSYVQSGCDLTDTDIGRYTSIGSSVKTVIGSHPVGKRVAMHPSFNDTCSITGFSYVSNDRNRAVNGKRTQIGSDVWIGNDVRIMGGVMIGDGAVIGAGAVVTRDIRPYSVNAGVPAKFIRYRFSEEQIERLLADKWWEKDEQWIRTHIEDFSDVEDFLK